MGERLSRSAPCRALFSPARRESDRVIRTPGEIHSVTVPTATIKCPHCGHEKTETMPTNACVHFYECSKCRRFFGQSLVTAASFARTGRADARPAKLKGRNYADAGAVYCRTRMKLSLVRLVATVLLSGQVLPVGLPLLCDQVQRATPANCDQQMASHTAGPIVAATTHATPCANSALCATTTSAVIALGGVVSGSASESHIVVSGVSTFAPADPQAPLPPPPQA